jgi:multiple sugar transport system permease protein
MARKQERTYGFIKRARTEIRSNHVLRRRIRHGVAAITLVVTLIWLLLPLFWIIETSLKSRPVAQAYPPVFWGFNIRWENYLIVLTDRNLIAFIQNGVIAATASTVLCLLLGVPHAYVISKYEYKFRQMSFYTILAVRIIPPITVAVPFFILYQKLGLINTLTGVTIVLTFLFEPFVVWIMKGFFDGLPSSLIDAALTDGCTKFQAFYKIMLPLALPGLGSAIIISWLLAWNEFTLVFFITTSEAAQTLPAGILNFVRDRFVPWNLIAAASVIGMIPSLIVVIIFQKYLIRGLVEERV